MYEEKSAKTAWKINIYKKTDSLVNN